MTKSDVEMLKQALVPKDGDYEQPCISPHNLEIILEQLLLEQQGRRGMTREEARQELLSALEEDYIPEPEAVEMAIRSLEAWENVVKELREEKRKENRPYSAIQIDAFQFGLGVAIDIINKYTENDGKE